MFVLIRDCISRVSVVTALDIACLERRASSTDDCCVRTYEHLLICRTDDTGAGIQVLYLHTGAQVRPLCMYFYTRYLVRQFWLQQYVAPTPCLPVTVLILGLRLVVYN